MFFFLQHMNFTGISGEGVYISGFVHPIRFNRLTGKVSEQSILIKAGQLS